MAEAEINLPSNKILHNQTHGLTRAFLICTLKIAVSWIILTLASFYAQAQTVALMEADVVTAQFDKLLTPVPVYRMTDAYILINKMQGQPIEKKLPVHLPAFTDAGDTAYFFLYSGTVLNSAVKGYVTVIVHHCCDNKPLQLYIDQNGNQNFRDDGPPVVWTIQEPEKNIALFHPDDTLKVVNYRLSRFNFWGKDAYLGMLDEYYKREEKNRTFAGIRFSFRSQQLNCKATRFTDHQDSVTIGILDANLNGLYNESGIDQIICSGYNQRVLSFEQGEQSGAMPVKTQSVLDFNEATYHISHIDSYGRFIHVKKEATHISKNGYMPGDKFPALKFNAWNNRKIKIRRIARKHPVYLHVVQFPYDQFQQDTALFVSLLKQYPDLRIVWLQYGGRPNNVNIIAQLPNVTWYMGYTQLGLNRNMRITKYPFGILLAPKRRVFAFNCPTSQLNERLLELMQKK